MRNAQLAAALAVLGLAGACSDDTKPPAGDTRPTTDIGITDHKVTDSPRPDGPAGPASFATFNAGLAAGAVPYATERRPLVVEALKQLQADVVCVQEAWTDDDSQAIIDGVKATFPFSFREKTEDTSTPAVKCTDLTAVITLKSCADTKCTPNGISVFDCVTGPCKAEYDPLTDDCKLCLGANTANPLPCAVGGAKEFVYDGRNGLLLLSRVELKNAKYTPFDTVVIKRGVLTATVGSAQVQCTHAPVDLGQLPYPKSGKYKTWVAEQAAAITALVAMASGPCTVLMGDLNAGPATGTLVGELPDNFKMYGAAGYAEPWATPVCTWCKENPLAGGTVDTWIDHVMFKGCTPKATSAAYARILDSEVTVKSGGKDVKTRLSDHYGLKAELK